MCEYLWGYQTKYSSRSLGAAALPRLMALKGPRTAKKIPGTTLFLLRASHRLLCPGDAAPDKRLWSCFEAVVSWGYSCCWGWAVGEDASRWGRAALAGMLAPSHTLCRGLLTSAGGSQRIRDCVPQHIVANTNRGMRRASVRSLCSVVVVYEISIPITHLTGASLAVCLLAVPVRWLPQG